MIVHPNFDPVAIKLGPVAIHWYGLMYLVGFAGFWWLGLKRAKQKQWQWPADRVSDLLFYGALGVILGGRLGYTLFYNFSGFLRDPLVILRIWEGGMSFHGGLLGVIVAYLLFARHHKLNPFDVADFAAPMIPVGLLTGRIGNFINGELWGKPTDLPWGMVFPHAPTSQPRHPTMLYEAFLEGLVMLVVLWWFARNPRPRMVVSGLFLVLYGCFRILVEFLRMPDAHLGYLAFGWVTMGMVLCLPMILAGALMVGLGYTRQKAAA